jgi:hypothetical protein
MPSSAPIQTSVPADNNIFKSEDADNIYNFEDADSYALEGVGVIALADDGLHDAIDDMPPLLDSTSELPRRVIATKQSHSDVSGSAKSWVWSYFKKVDAAGKHCLCLICQTEVNYSYTKSTGTLGCHIKKFHQSVWQQRLHHKAEVSISTSSTSTLSLDPFLKHCPKFEKCLVKWMIATYQPLCCVEDQHFRAMCQSLHSKAPIISRVKLSTLISEESHLAELKVKNILKGRFFSFTTDGWTSLNHKAYVTCTNHFIDSSTWQLHAVVMGLYEKDGGSKHEDIVCYCEQQLTLFGLDCSKAVAVITDTESTMIAAGRLFVSNSQAQSGRTKWLGCIGHLVQLCTKLAFKGKFFVLFFLTFILI